MEIKNKTATIEILTAVSAFITSENMTISSYRSRQLLDLIGETVNESTSFNKEIYDKVYRPLVDQSILFSSVMHKPTFASLFDSDLEFGYDDLDDDYFDQTGDNDYDRN